MKGRPPQYKVLRTKSTPITAPKPILKTGMDATQPICGGLALCDSPVEPPSSAMAVPDEELSREPVESPQPPSPTACIARMVSGVMPDHPLALEHCYKNGDAMFDAEVLAAFADADADYQYRKECEFAAIIAQLYP
jgi:hypothetical protein